MFHCIKKFYQRVVSLIAYIYEFKIIYISLLFTLGILLSILLLRNNFSPLTIGLFYTYFCILLSILVCFCSRKIAAKENLSGSDVGSWKDSISHMLGILVFSLCITTTTLLYSCHIVNKEKNVSEFGTSFTTGYTSSDVLLLSEPTQKHSTQQLEVSPLRDININGKVLPKNSTKLLLKTEPYRQFEIGEICSVSGTPVEPKNSEDFNYKDFLKNKDIYFLMDYPKIECLQKNKGFFLRRNLVNMKEKLIGLVEKSLKEPQSSLFVGILFGQERLFSKDFEKNIRIAGVSHIVAASGYNVTILLIVLNSIFKFLPKKVRIILSIAIIWCFCLLSGVSPSIVRACIMASISLMGILLGRKNSIHITFLLCIFVFVVFKPKILLDVGFQLSVFATCGLIYLLPSITKSLKITGEGFLKDTVLTTISCTLTTLPISILTFKTFSLWSVLANTLILPVVESTMLFGTLAMIFSSRFLYLVVHLQLKYVETVVNLIGNSEFGYWDVQSGKWFVITLIIFLLLFCIYFYPVDDESTNYYLKIYS